MKFAKIYNVLAGAAVVLCMASCEENTTSTFQKPDPATFKMNTPVFQDQYYTLTEEGTFELVVAAQPSYGFSAITQYRAQVALSPDDFADESKYRELTPTGTGTLTRMVLNDIDLTEAICELKGIKEAADFNLTEMPVYFRGAAFIDGVEDSYVTTSNVVALNHVTPFFSVAKPGVIFVVGNYLGEWIGVDQPASAFDGYTLSEKPDEIRSKKYYGTISFDPAVAEKDGAIFRFYTELGDWDANSFGPSGGPDSDTPVEFADFAAGSTLEQGLAKTKDSFKFNNYRGTLEFEVDIKAMKAIITAPK